MLTTQAVINISDMEFNAVVDNVLKVLGMNNVGIREHGSPIRYIEATYYSIQVPQKIIGITILFCSQSLSLSTPKKFRKFTILTHGMLYKPMIKKLNNLHCLYLFFLKP